MTTPKKTTTKPTAKPTSKVTTPKTTVTKPKTTVAKPPEQVIEKVVKLQPNPFQHEILELASDQKSDQKKVEILKEYRNDALVSLLIWNFDSTVISVLPEGAVPYADPEEQSSVGGNLTDLIESKSKNTNLKNGAYAGTDEVMNKQHTSLRNEYRNFYMFVKGGNNELSRIRKETMFINILKGLHPQEAELLCLVKDKKLTDKYKISFEVVKEAYPDIRWGGRS